ncbi:unnamed protein product [Rotaria sp. Silwood2]|nr:unnamed protein product [Rotaria sp. Silwood2]CAF2848950.1 unnamed protein product [Rotaria sp. Silwood2]CAF3130934.1 unnamed protein product [Rotaria sp. Silwood2]CAF3261850.1 unnamed protein product [Rotaria sp. Silwood2]CAF4263050.1 unnamed protein product [Rotaria sp. Silwood2]
MAASRRNAEKFSCKTSRFLLPAFRRPSYREIIATNSICDPEGQVFSKWSEEDGQYYCTINTALLNDDDEVLKKNARFINSLRMAIKNNSENEFIKVYRGLSIDHQHVKQEYTVGLQFLLPTFTCTSKNKDVAHRFGDYLFEIDASNDDWTYRSDISKYSIYPEEQEILFYPYSGYVVQNIIHDARIIQLKCIDTLNVESTCRERIPSCVKIFDSSRNMFVYFYKDSSNVHWSRGDKPNEIFLIAENQNGYWDAPYRYHHRNGYFIDKGNDRWEEYQNNRLHARFTRVVDDDNDGDEDDDDDNNNNDNDRNDGCQIF